MTLRYPVLTLRRADLVAAGACAEWLSIYDDICRLRGDERDAAVWVSAEAPGVQLCVRDRTVVTVMTVAHLMARRERARWVA